MLVPFRSFAFLRMFCLSLNRKSFQTIVLGLLLLFLPALCAPSISTGLWMQELNPGFWTLNPGSWTLDTLMLNFGRWALDTGHFR